MIKMTWLIKFPNKQVSKNINQNYAIVMGECSNNVITSKLKLFFNNLISNFKTMNNLAAH